MRPEIGIGTGDDARMYHWGRQRRLGDDLDMWANLRAVYDGSYEGSEGFEKAVVLECFGHLNAADGTQQVFQNVLDLVNQRWVQTFHLMSSPAHGWVAVREPTSAQTMGDFIAWLAAQQGFEAHYEVSAYVLHELLLAWLYLEGQKLSPHGALEPHQIAFTHVGELKVCGYGYNRLRLLHENLLQDRKQLVFIVKSLIEQAPNSSSIESIRAYCDSPVFLQAPFQELYAEFSRNISLSTLEKGRMEIVKFLSAHNTPAKAGWQSSTWMLALSGQWLDTVEHQEGIDNISEDLDARLRFVMVHGLSRAARNEFAAGEALLRQIDDVADTMAQQSASILKVMYGWLRGGLGASLEVPLDSISGRDLVSFWLRAFEGRWHVMRADYPKAYEALSGVYAALSEFALERSPHPVWAHLIQPSSLRDHSLAWMAMIDVLVFDSDEGLGHISAVIDKHARSSQIWWLLEAQSLQGLGLYHRRAIQRALDTFRALEALAKEHGQTVFAAYARKARQSIRRDERIPFFGDHNAWLDGNAIGR